MTPENMFERLNKGEDPLELSIEKWKDIEEGSGESYGAENCGLCADNYRCGTCPAHVLEESCCNGLCDKHDKNPTVKNARAVRIFLEELRK